MKLFIYSSICMLLGFTLAPGKDFKGAELRTKENYLYGRFEVNYKPAAGTGILSSFFLYHDFTSSTADWNEVDIEILGRYDDDIQCTTIHPKQFIHNSHSTLPFNPHEGFHTYAFEWTPDYVAWFADGQEIYRQQGELVQDLTRPSKLMMNTWADDGDGTWTGPWLPETLPYFSLYDWVACYAFTPDSGNAGTDNNFRLLWRDDFNSWDTTRWEKAAHTWGGNKVDFSHDNAVFKDGHLILCLTDAAHQGYQDRQPPSILWARKDGDYVTVQFSEKVDSLVATDKSKYSLTGQNIEQIYLSADQRSVQIKVSGTEAPGPVSLVIFGLKDLWDNIQAYDLTTVITQEPLSFPVNINIGGAALFNGEYLPDQVWGPDVQYGRMDGYEDKYPASTDILNTTQDSLYLQGVHEIAKYRLRCPDGIYNVVLRFSEGKYAQAGQRYFDINIEDQYVARHVDVYQQAGQFAALDLRFENIAVNDGLLQVSFDNAIGDPILNGLSVEQVSTALTDRESGYPARFELGQNYPNPFNPGTTISYQLPEAGFVKMNIYDTRGALITNVLSANRTAGRHQLRLRLNLASGIYFYELQLQGRTGIFRDMRKMVVLK